MMFNRLNPYVWFPSAVPFINCACNVGTQDITAETIPWDFKHDFFLLIESFQVVGLRYTYHQSHTPVVVPGVPNQKNIPSCSVV